MLKEEFADSGFEVLTTDSGAEALKFLDDPARSVKLVITNLRHAGPQGLDFLRLLKRGWPELPVICFTALSEYKDLSPDDRPFDAFVEKASDLTRLKQNVDKLLGRTG